MTDKIDNIAAFQALEGKLAVFGLSPMEARIYLALSNRTSQTVMQLSRILRIPRTSIYDNMQKLIERGLVERIVRYKSQEFRAYPLEILDTFIDKEKSYLENLTLSLDFLKTNIHKAGQLATPKTQVRYYHGPSGIRQMMWNALSAEKENIGYSVMGRREIVGGKFLHRFLEEFGKRNLTDRVLINPTKHTIQYIRDGNLSLMGKLANFERIRVIDEKQLKITGDTTIYNYVFAVMYWQEGEIVGVEIENPELVKMQKSMFEILWKIAKPLKVI
jgi:sugar-specific transcriptional regulator TrmB